MAKVLVIFGSTHGHTARVAGTMSDRLRVHGHHVDCVNAGAAPPPDPAGYDAVLVAASLHIGAYQREVVGWATQNAPSLNQRPTAFVSVSLGVLQHDAAVQRDLQTIVDRFVKTTGWRPLDVEFVAGALLYTRYNILVRWLMKRIARKAGGATDTSRDYDYTDWPALQRFTDRFAARLAAPEPTVARAGATGA